MACLLAMHMADQLLSLPVAGVAWLAAMAAVAAASRLSRRQASEKLPLMGVMGAFVFAAQMVNFTLPLMPGTSGHLGGAVLLAVLLGPWAGIVTMAGILIVQCLLFQDGGLLALGCNILNMGVAPCLLGYAVYRAVLGRTASAARQYLGAWLACVIGVAAGAAMVPLESAVSGVLRIAAGDFLAVMVGVHLLIGTVEGLITFAVLAYLRQVHPQWVGASAGGQPVRLSKPAVAASLVVVALLLAGVVSWFASAHPDGLEWSYQEHPYAGADKPVAPPSPAVAAVEAFQARYSPMPDYGRREAPLGRLPQQAAPDSSAKPRATTVVNGWGSLAGLVGTAVTLGLLYAVSVMIRRPRRAVRDASRGA
jgi:cobalt/nickel transport system permease protein